MKRFFWLFLLMFGFILVGCSNDDDDVIEQPTPDAVEMIVLSEGQFMQSTAAISAITYGGEMQWDVYRDVNGQALGDAAQSITYLDGKYFVTLSNSGMIRVIDPKSFQRIKTIESENELFTPRFIVPINDTEALVSDMNAQLVKINYKDYTIVEHIDLSSKGIYYIEKMTRIKDKIFCTVVMPDTYEGSYVWVYDINNFQPLNPQIIPIQGIPVTAKLIEDANGKLWVLGEKREGEGDDFRATPVLHRIDPLTYSVEYSYEIPVVFPDEDGYKEGCITGAPAWGNRLETNAQKNELYLVLHTWEGENTAMEAVYSFNVTTNKLNNYRLLPGLSMLYGMNISPSGEVYVCDALDYTAQRGYVRHYKADKTVDSKKVGIFPRMVHFTGYDK